MITFLTKGIGRRFAIYILLFSSIITLVITAIQLAHDYRRDIDIIEKRLQEIQVIYQETLSTAIWVHNENGLILQLQGMMRLPDMLYVQVNDELGDTIATDGNDRKERIIKHTFELTHLHRGKKIFLGEVIVLADLNAVYQRLVDKLVVILISQAIKTFLVSLFILFLFHLLIGKHLLKLAAAAREISGGSFKLLLNIGHNDELSDVSHAFNEMSTRLDTTMEELKAEIAEHKKLEIALKQAKEEADSANRMKSEFLANMSHEIRTPMNAIVGFSDLLRTLVTDKKQKKYLDNIKTSSKTLLTLINDILDLSKIEAGRLQIQYEPIDIHFLFHEIEQIFTLKTTEKGLDFFIEIEKDLPMGLIIDEIRLRQVLINLVGNAVKFTKKGYVKLSVRKIFREGHSKINLIVVVEDTGIGIPENQQAKMFEAFSQMQGQNTRQYGGTGLGLAISKRLVELMNGKISLHSIEGKGSVFEIILKDVELSAIEEKQKQTIDLENITFEKATVLVVDDIESNRNLIQECLNEVNLNVIEAQNGEESLLFAKEYQPDLILMDLKMPIMDGYEATKELKTNEKTKYIPIVALTAAATSEEKQKIEASLFDGYLYKPVNIFELLEKLSQHLEIIKEKTKVEKVKFEAKSVEYSEKTLSPEEITKLPELLKILEKELLSKSEELANLMEIDAIESFAKRTIELGEIYHVKLLIDYGRNLIEVTETFELDNVEKMLKEFDKNMKKINKMKG